MIENPILSISTWCLALENQGAKKNESNFHPRRRQTQGARLGGHTKTQKDYFLSKCSL